MSSIHSSITRRLALGALTSAALLASVPALAEGQMVDVRIINRESGKILPLYPYKGDLWVAGEPGARYAIQLHNETRGRLLNVVSVDGVNVVSALCGVSIAVLRGAPNSKHHVRAAKSGMPPLKLSRGRG